MTDLLFLSGNQLFDPARLTEYRQTPVVLCESHALCSRMPFHQQKLGFLLAAMREHGKALRQAGFDVHYHRLTDRVDVTDALITSARKTGATRIVRFDSEDRGLNRAVAKVRRCLNLREQVLPSPMFLLDTRAVDAYFTGTKKPRMAPFYRRQRVHMKLLLDGDGPLGGRWSFDESNRHRFPRDRKPPALPPVRHSTLTRQCLEEVEARYPDHPGTAGALWLPTDRPGALGWLDQFLQTRFTGFGTYEDALSVRSPTLFHSTLSPFLNVGLITPDEVVERALQAAEALDVPLNDLEGFLRQIVGWREFMRGVYRHHRKDMRSRNVWGAERTMTADWLNGRTGIAPLDIAMRTTRDYGWNHHIERLMVIANLMNLAEIHPGEVYRFFMTHYIDAYDWVMVPNVFGMGLTSDGGIFSSKPYICGSNYIRRMSDYPKGDWTDVMDGLYWRFVAKHRAILARNPRLAMMTRGLDRIDARRRKRISERAEAFLSTTTGYAH